MRRIASPWLLGLGVVLLVGGVRAAITNGNAHAWKVIAERNAFGLKKPAPPPEVKPQEQPKPTTDVTLTGIASMLGSTKAYLITKEQGKNEPVYVSLAAGEKDGVIEVLEINEKAGTVKIKNSGMETVLNFKDNGIKTAAAAPGPPPGMPVVMPGGRPFIPVPPPASSAGSPLPGGLNPASGAGSTSSPLLRTIPTRPSRLPGATQSQNTTVPHPPPANVSAEESIVLMEVTRTMNEAKIKAGEFPQLPPTPLTPQQSKE